MPNIIENKKATLLAKYFLHTVKSNGFTLVELLVVITIIVILASVGTVVYRGITQSARDTTRKADVTAIAKAYEANYSSGVYLTLAPANFAAGKIPDPPEGGNYYSVTDGSGFKVCAKLESYSGIDNYCNTVSNDCFCTSSAQGTIQPGSTLYGNGSEIGTGTNNLIANSSFESGSAGWNFGLYQAGTASGTGSVTNTKSYFGNSSYQINDTGGLQEVRIDYNGGLNFTAGKNYRISAWIYTTTPRAAIQGHFGGGWGSSNSFEVHVPSNKLNQWYQVSVTKTAGSSNPALRCGAFYGSQTPGTVYCDGIVVEEVP